MNEYHKIYNIYERDKNTKRIIEGKFTNEEFEFLKDNVWQFTEKVDGTNIRIMWDGYNIKFAGRTENALIPIQLSNRLFELFGGKENEQLFEQKFRNTSAILYGEGYGAGIQTGGAYSKRQEFILFDVKINDNWQPRENIEEIANYFGIQAVPIVLTGTLQQGVEFIKTKPLSAIAEEEYTMEGIIGKPIVELKNRVSNRIVVKIKTQDYKIMK